MKFEHEAQNRVLVDYLAAVENTTARLAALSKDIVDMVETWSLRPLVMALQALRGVQLLTAVIVVAEIGNFDRFASAPKLMAHLGLVPSEHSSGEVSRRGRITRCGNRSVRTALVESAWNNRFRPKVTWQKLSYTHRREQVRAIEEAKKPETRQRRIEMAVAMLSVAPQPTSNAKKKSPQAGSAIDDYIKGFPAKTKKRLEALRRLIQSTAPGATEKISYGIPTFYLDGNLVHFAAYEHHIGFYPGASGIATFKKELSGYKSAKGSVQLPLSEPMPIDLIRRIVAHRVRENTSKAKAKASKGA